MNKTDYKTIAKVIKDVTLQALEHFEGYELLAVNDVIQLVKEELSTEFMKHDDKFSWLEFYQNCDIED